MEQPLEVTVTPGGPEVEIAGKEVPAPVAPPSAEELLKQADALGDQLRALIVLAKRLPKEKGAEAHQDPARALSLAQMNLQTGFMWLRRAISPQKAF